MKFTPWTNDSTLGSTTYDLVNIVGDTTTVEQADNDVTTIEHEFRAEPLYESTRLGSKTVTTECIDFQNDVLKNMFGWRLKQQKIALSGKFALFGWECLAVFCRCALALQRNNALELSGKKISGNFPKWLRRKKKMAGS